MAPARHSPCSMRQPQSLEHILLDFPFSVVCCSHSYWPINLSRLGILSTSELVKKVIFPSKYLILKCALAWIIFTNLFYYLTYIFYYLWVSLHFLVLFMGATVSFHLTFTFIYSTFSKKFLVSAK